VKLVLIVGSGAVGKMTVGQELMKITDLRFQNSIIKIIKLYKTMV
jgi:shikimate kinase